MTLAPGPVGFAERALGNDFPQWPFVLNQDNLQAHIGMRLWYPIAPVHVGRAFDLSGNALNGTLTNGAALSVVAPFGHVFDFGAQLDNKDITFDYASGSRLSYGTADDLWVSFWRRHNTNTTRNTAFIWIADDNSDAWGLSTDSASATDWFIFTFGGNSGTIGGVPAVGDWQHIVVYFGQSENRLAMWTDGTQLYENASYTDNSAADNGRIEFGNRTDAGNWDGNGQMADIRVGFGRMTDEIAWHLYDPRTRWDLYWEPDRVLYSLPGAGAAGTLTRAASLDAAIRAQVAFAASLDAGVRRERSDSASLDAAVGALRAGTARLDAAVRAAAAATLTLDAAIRAAAAGDLGVDAALAAGRTLAAAIDAALEDAGTLAASLDAFVSGQDARQRTLALDAAAQAVAEARASLDAALRGALSAAVGIDGVIGIQFAPAGGRTARAFGGRSRDVPAGGRTLDVPAGRRVH